jgi:FAD/FMN-containing dehydrogenase
VSVAADLARVVGAEHVLAPPPAWALHDATEWAGLRGSAEALVRPGSTEEVAGVVAWCAERGVPVTPRGGGTGLAGGCVPDGGVVLALDRLDRVVEVEPESWRMVVGAGVTTARVRRVAAENGLHFPPDPGAAESSQIGGNVATNAGGPHTLGFGATRRWVVGVEAVLGTGEVLDARRLHRDVAPYDLLGLLCGSEGTLAVITEVHLRLLPAYSPEPPVLAFYDDAEAGCAAAAAVLAEGQQPAVLDFLDAGALASAGRSGGFALLAEGAELEGAVASDDVWRWREGIAHAVAAQRGGKLSEDVAVPLARLAELVDGTVEIGARHGLEACSWGHAGDGISHGAFMLDASDARQVQRAHAAAEELFDLALALGGTLSGEHGLGRLKAHRAEEALGAPTVAAMRAVKAALDPLGILNPGVKLPRGPLRDRP